jgi:hypothetical protein
LLQENLPLFSNRSLAVETDRSYDRKTYPDAQ